MAQMFGLARLGRDTELRRTPSGDAVAGLSLAFSYGRKGNDGKRPTQWVEGALWGKRAEALASHMTKGTMVSVTLDEVHIETFNKSDGTTGSKLAGRVTDIEFAGGGNGQASAPAPAPKPPPPAQARGGFDDMDDDIPF